MTRFSPANSLSHSHQPSPSEGLTLIDLIHITALILIIGATVLTIVADRQLETGKKQSVRRFDFRNAIICGTLFIGANAALIVHAAIRG